MIDELLTMHLQHKCLGALLRAFLFLAITILESNSAGKSETEAEGLGWISQQVSRFIEIIKAAKEHLPDIP